MNNRRGFSFIELIMIIIIMGILSAVAIPKYMSIVASAEIRAEKSFVNDIWEGLEDVAEDRFLDTGVESWPYNPLSVVGRTRNIIINLTTGYPIERNEWRFNLSDPNSPILLHKRNNYEVWGYTYDSLTFTLSEEPELF